MAKKVQPFYLNPTFWVNLVMVTTMILSGYCGIQVPPELQAAVVGLVNIVLQAPSMAVSQRQADSRNAKVAP